ncbi:PKD domain-containing protein [Methanosarcina hadiensis]|uniref:PKD domain-containing protein n=1 Tax=Methanosarcina hadiensis TaxID=3078083 RepID=UPI00397758A1
MTNQICGCPSKFKDLETTFLTRVVYDNSCKIERINLLGFDKEDNHKYEDIFANGDMMVISELALSWLANLIYDFSKKIPGIIKLYLVKQLYKIAQEMNEEVQEIPSKINELLIFIIKEIKRNPWKNLHILGLVLVAVLLVTVLIFAVTESMVLSSTSDLASDKNVSEPILPIANFSVTPTSGYAPMDVIFTDNSINSIYKWWNFGDGIGTGSSVNPINHTYFKAGKYKVYLKVTNAVGNNTSGPTCITVNEIFYAFDPNNGNDGKSPWGESLSSLPSYETYHLPAKEGYIIVENQYDFIDDTTSNYSDSDPTDGNGFYISILSPDKGHWSCNGSYTPEEDSTKGLIPGSQDNVGIIGKDGGKNMPSGKGTKLRVYSPYTRTTVIAVVGGNGPAPYTGCQFGASNKVFKALGLPDSYNGSSKENPNPGYASNKSDPEKYPVIRYADNPYWVEVSWADQSLPAGPLKLGNKSR